MTFFRTNIGLWTELLRLCWRRSRGLFLVSVACLALEACTTTLIGIGLRAVVQGGIAGSRSEVLAGAIGAALGYAVSLLVGETGESLRIVLGTIVAYEEVEFQNWQATMGRETLDHLERPDYLDRLRLLHTVPRSFPLLGSAWTAVETVAYLLRVAMVVALLGGIDPLMVLVLLTAVLPVVLGQRARLRENATWTATSEDDRLQEGFLALATRPESSKEVRLTGSGPELVRRQRAAATRVRRIRAAAQYRTMAWEALGWCLFSLSFVGGLALVVFGGAAVPARAGDLVLTVVVGVQLRSVIEQTVRKSTISGYYGPMLDAYQWLRETNRAERRPGARTAPERLDRGIVFEGVAFSYSEDTGNAVSDLSFELPAGSVVALVGSYGSGKSTVVKLLSKLYRPTAGRILVDGVDLASLDTDSWRGSMTAAFQDFGRYRMDVDEAIGLGDLAAGGDRERIGAAVRAAGADDLVAGLPDGLKTRLGRDFGGTELSEGQWQKIALARASMRRGPLLTVLDEPTASLDAPSEKAVFESYMATARENARERGGITVIVSHRFSTVAGADLVLVLKDGRLVEAGSHRDLVRTQPTDGTGDRGWYATLYGQQEAAYQN